MIDPPSARSVRLLPLVVPVALAACCWIPTSVKAQYNSRCSTDYFGNINCRDSEGSSLRYTPNPWGNGSTTTYTDGDGNSVRCRTTSFGYSSQTSCY